MLRQIVSENWFTAGVIGLWPANSEGDDILIFADEARSHPWRYCMRCANSSAPRRPPQRRARRFRGAAPSGLADYVGAFVVTAGMRRGKFAERFKRANDDYSAIMAKALADRLAEAWRNIMHQTCTPGILGYASDEKLCGPELIARKISRHPPGARLSRAAGSHREGDAVCPPRRRAADRRAPDRKLCDVARRIRIRLLFQPSGKATILVLARSSATRSKTMRRARSGPSSKPKNGWPRSSITIRSPPCAMPPSSQAVASRDAIDFGSGGRK